MSDFRWSPLPCEHGVPPGELEGTVQTSRDFQFTILNILFSVSFVINTRNEILWPTNLFFYLMLLN